MGEETSVDQGSVVEPSTPASNTTEESVIVVTESQRSTVQPSSNKEVENSEKKPPITNTSTTDNMDAINDLQSTKIQNVDVTGLTECLQDMALESDTTDEGQAQDEARDKPNLKDLLIRYKTAAEKTPSLKPSLKKLILIIKTYRTEKSKKQRLVPHGPLGQITGDVTLLNTIAQQNNLNINDLLQPFQVYNHNQNVSTLTTSSNLTHGVKRGMEDDNYSNSKVLRTINQPSEHSEGLSEEDFINLLADIDYFDPMEMVVYLEDENFTEDENNLIERDEILSMESSPMSTTSYPDPYSPRSDVTSSPAQSSYSPRSDVASSPAHSTYSTDNDLSGYPDFIPSPVHDHDLPEIVPNIPTPLTFNILTPPTSNIQQNCVLHPNNIQVSSPPNQAPTLMQGPPLLHQVPSPIQQVPSPLQQARSPIQQVPSPLQQVPSPLQQVPSPIQQVPSPLQQAASPQQPSLRQQVPPPLQQPPPIILRGHTMVQVAGQQYIPQPAQIIETFEGQPPIIHRQIQHQLEMMQHQHQQQQQQPPQPQPRLRPLLPKPDPVQDYQRVVTLPNPEGAYQEVLGRLPKQEQINARCTIAMMCDNFMKADPEGDTVLHIIVSREDRCSLIALLDRCVRASNLEQAINLTNNLTQTPLFVATLAEDPVKAGDLFTILLHYGADPTIHTYEDFHTEERTFVHPIHHVASRGNRFAPAVSKLLGRKRQEQLNLTCSKHYTALHHAASSHDTISPSGEVIMSDEVIMTLLQHGANINAMEGRRGCTPLHFIIETKDVDLLECVLTFLARDPELVRSAVNSARYDRYTSLHMAASLKMDSIKHKKMLILLMRYGGDANIRNGQNQRPSDLLQGTNPELVGVLKGVPAAMHQKLFYI